MSTPEAADPLAQLAADEVAEREAQQAQAQVAPPPADNTPEPTAEPGEEVPEWKQRGFRDEQAMWQSYQELERKFRERDNEIGELRKFQREAAQMQQQAQPQANQQTPPAFDDGVPIFTLDELQQMVEDGRTTDFQAQAHWAMQMARFEAMQMEDRIAQRLAPIEQVNQRHGTQDALDALNAAVGDDMVARHAELVGRMIQEDLKHYSDTKNGGRRLIEAVKAAELDYRENGASQPRAQNGQFAPADTFVEGGSGAQGPVAPGGTRLDPEEAALINTLVPKQVVDEAGIRIPWAR